MKPCSIYKGLYALCFIIGDSYGKFITVGDKVTTSMLQ